jgi:hypothetical protein
MPPTDQHRKIEEEALMMMVSSRLILATALALSTSAALAANVFFDPDAVKHSCVVESLGTTLPPGEHV